MTVVATLIKNKLFEDPEFIVITVIVSLVVMEHPRLTPSTKHETTPLNDGARITFSHVKTLNDEPICVANVGVTTNVMLL